jgi:hypothetical protein
MINFPLISSLLALAPQPSSFKLPLRLSPSMVVVERKSARLAAANPSKKDRKQQLKTSRDSLISALR